MRFLIFFGGWDGGGGGVLRMKMYRYSIITFGEIPLPYVKRISLKVFFLVMVSCSRIFLMEDSHVD